jgi:hypothetical protein
MERKTPSSIAIEHDELHTNLVKATQAGGRTGEAAQTVADLLHAHFQDEEAYALPPLALLPMLAEGTLPPESAQILEMTGKLKANLGQMIAEHRAIQAALQTLIAAATDENKPEHAEFARKLMLHAQNEEEILYPAALLIGEYLKLRLETQ